MDDDALVSALQAELDAYRRESAYVKDIIALARMWSDARADREALSMRRKIVELTRENKALRAGRA